MNPTVTQPIRTRPPDVTDPKQLDAFLKEFVLWARQTRQATNTTYRAKATLPTEHTGAFTTIWASPDIGVGFSWFVEATIMADAGSERSTFVIQGMFYNNGAVTQKGATLTPVTINTAAFAVQFIIVDNHIEAQVQDNGALDVNWSAVVEVAENQA